MNCHELSMIEFRHGSRLLLTIYEKNDMHRNFCKRENNTKMAGKLQQLQGRLNRLLDFDNQAYLRIANKLNNLLKGFTSLLVSLKVSEW